MSVGITRALNQALNRFHELRVLVIGDVMLDRSLVGEVSRISPEAPIPVLHVEQETNSPGGAANVAVNLSKLGARVGVVGVVGSDRAGEDLVQLLSTHGIETSGIVTDDSRPTIVKQRHIANRQQMLRCDWESRGALSERTQELVLEQLESLLPGVHVLICSDYAKGLLTESILHRARVAQREFDIPVVVDPKAQSLDRYRGVSFVTPNESEFHLAYGVDIADEEALQSQVCPDVKRQGWSGLLVTRGGQGVTIIGIESVEHIPSQRVEVFDVVGAGDTFIATIALGLASKLSIQHAATLANIAGGIVVNKVGTASTTTEELRARLPSLRDSSTTLTPSGQSSSKKVGTWQEALAVIDEARRSEKKIVFTNGCFDILHKGHLHILKQARKQGDFLIVGINSDSSIKEFKSKNRPIFNEEDRVEMVAAFPFVDFVVLFSETTPLKLIEFLEPDILVKGADYRKDEVVGAAFVEARGGKVVLIDLIEGMSTTAALEKAVQEIQRNEQS